MNMNKSEFIKVMQNKRKENAQRRALCAIYENDIERDASRADFFRDICERRERDTDVVLHTMIH